MRTILFTLCLGWACSSPLDMQEPDGSQLENKSEAALPESVLKEYQAPFFLDTAYIEGTELSMVVSYGGGCEKHDFMLVWPEIITMVYPPDFGVTLYHQNITDHCEALITDTLRTDLRETPLGSFNEETIARMRITVVNGSKPEVSKSTR